MEINEVKYGFKLVSVKSITDLNSTLYEYQHIKSGGTVAYLENDDTNCCFAIGFRTLPHDSTGVCHIIEHSVLCGSEKYPLKEPFVNLIKGSMATFLNAFTANDWTMYPFSSQTPKDFDNILSVYMDAVFNPLSVKDPKPFLQEGWHLELTSKDETPCYKGVVYNEMKGAMSSVEEVLTQATLGAMYKDSFYAENSGGEPSIIPTLTWEAYKSFYHKHYTPQNALTFFYGKMDIEERLKFVDKEYFSKYDKSNEEIIITNPKPLIDTNYEIDYEISPSEDTKDNTYMSLCFALDSYENNEEFIAWQVLTSALLSKNNSPLKKKLLDAKLGQDIVSRIDDDKINPALHVYLYKTNHSKKEEFKKVFLDSVNEIIKEGIDKELLLATINHAEFKDKELDVSGISKGILIAMNMMGSFNYRGSLDTHLQYSNIYAKLRKELNNGYFENLLSKYILNSNHFVEVVINPSKTLGEERKNKMDKLMASLKAQMTEEEINKYVKQTQELIAYQNHIDTKKELDTLPKLSIKDIPTTINYLDGKKISIAGYKGIKHQLSTNGIAYFRMYFDENVIKYEDLPYCLLLSRVLGNLATKNYSSSELNTKVKSYLGDLKFSQSISSKSKNECITKFKVITSALEENIDKIPELLTEILTKTKFTPKEVKQVLLQLVNAEKMSLIEDGMSIATTMVRSSSSLEGNYTSQALLGPNVYDFLNNLSSNYNGKEVCAKLKEIAKTLFTKKNCFISISGDEAIINKLVDATKSIKLPTKKNEVVLLTPCLSKINNALVVPSGVSYNALGNNLEDLGYKSNGKLKVLTHIVNYDYLWPEVRVKGGAYGTGLRVTQSNDIYFGSYRDPNVKNTYQVYKNLPTYLEKFKPSKDEFKTYLIGAVGGFDAPMSNAGLINLWDLFYLIGITKKDRINIKKEMLHTTREDISSYASLFKTLAENNSCYTVGNEAKIKEYNNFDSIRNI